MISTLVDHIGEHADDMAFIHSLTSKTNTHGPGENYMSTGFTLDGFPSIGAWATYALGSEVDDLPAFVDLRSARYASVDKIIVSRFPCLAFKVPILILKPIENLVPPSGITADADKATRGFLRRLNQDT